MPRGRFLSSKYLPANRVLRREGPQQHSCPSRPLPSRAPSSRTRIARRRPWPASDAIRRRDRHRGLARATCDCARRVCPGRRADRASDADLVAPCRLAYDTWRGLSAGCTYLAPKEDSLATTATSTFVFHFHAGQMAERQLKEERHGRGLRLLRLRPRSAAHTPRHSPIPIASAAMLGRAREEPRDHDAQAELKAAISRSTRGSAGFARRRQILGVDRYYAMCRYRDPQRQPALAVHGPEPEDRIEGRGARRREDAPLVHSLRPDASAAAAAPPRRRRDGDHAFGDHSARTTRARPIATQAVLTAIGRPQHRRVDDAAGPGWLGMAPHETGRRRQPPRSGIQGRGPKDHFDTSISSVKSLRSGWFRGGSGKDRLVYTLAGVSSI